LDEDSEALPSILIGAYMIIRGLSFFLGGFPNEAKIITQLSDEISGWILLYFMLFSALSYAGVIVQIENDYIKNFRSQWEER
jgi:hypothetical protein